MAEYILLLAVVMGVVSVFRVVFLQNLAPRLTTRFESMATFEAKGLGEGSAPLLDSYYTGYGGAHADAQVIVK